MNIEIRPEDASDILDTNAFPNGSPRFRLLCIAEILRTMTDENHGLTARQIGDAVYAICGVRPSEPTILSDLHALVVASPLGMEIETSEHGKNKGFRRKKTFVNSSQARLLLHMVRTCKFISPLQRNELCAALHETVSVYQQDEISGSALIDERERPATLDVYNIVDAATAAMERGRNLRFKYCNRGFDGREEPMTAPSGGTIFEETPIALVFSFGNYYLETWGTDSQGEPSKMTRRLDKMRDAAVSNNSPIGRKEIQSLAKNIETHVGEQVDMWGDGISRTLFLEVDKSKLSYVYDRFGSDLSFKHIEKTGTKGYACITIQLGSTFYRWIFGMGDGVRITKPASELWASEFWEDTPLAQKNLEELLVDYEAALRGLKEQLAQTARTYNWISTQEAEEQSL